MGHPVLYRRGRAVKELRRKDLALLAYLCLEGGRVHPRGILAALLWGDSPESHARHSLTQTLGRLQKALGKGALELVNDGVRLHGARCDAAVVLGGDPDHPEVDDVLTIYAGHFLEGFVPGPGAGDFEAWADATRGAVRGSALRLLERRGQAADAAGEWERALVIGERAVEIDPAGEQGRRRVLRALLARGEQARALRYYREFEAWLAEEVGIAPHPETRALAPQVLAGEPQARSALPAPEAAVSPGAVAPPPAPPAASEPAPSPGPARTWLGRSPPLATHAVPSLVAVVAVLLLLLTLAQNLAVGDRPAAPASGKSDAERDPGRHRAM